VDEAIVQRGGRFCLFVTDRVKVTGGHMKALTIELARPTFNGIFRFECR
jgi:hypothetical protein